MRRSSQLSKLVALAAIPSVYCGECAHGFVGADCSQRSCPKGAAFFDMAEIDDTAHLQTTCSGKGRCDHKTGECSCASGFVGIACERTRCKNDCSHRGKCISMRFLADSTRNHESLQYSYQLWDADKLYGCQCDLGYAGYDCSLRVCPYGDDPLTTSATDDEVQLLRCKADASSNGHMVLYFDGKHSSSISVSSSAMALQHALTKIPLIVDVKVSYSTGNTLCRDDGFDNIVSITFTQNPGPLPPLVAETFDMEPASLVEIAASSSFGMLTDHNGVHHFSIKGNKENEECSNRGICNQETGSCDCFDTNGDKYAGNDCSEIVTSPVSNCPGDPTCSNRGVCDSNTKRCICEDGFIGGDCSQRSCPHGLTWFGYPSTDDVAHDMMSECSNMGTCLRTTGECRCNDGFFGSACEYMGCSGETSCNGNGRCVSLREVALNHKNDDGTLSPVHYGNDANEASTWDADRIFGCECDEGFVNFDCSLKTCPTGIDPLADSTDLYICSNKGLCDETTGLCKCFSGWGSSDGGGSYGTKNDCGRRQSLRGYP